MRANCNKTELMTSNGSWLKDPYFVSGDTRKSIINQTFVVDFLLCVDVDGSRRVIEKTSLHFNQSDEDATINFEGDVVPLIPHLMAGNPFILEDVVSLGHPAYLTLGGYFDESFTDFKFVENDFTWFYKIWGLKKIKFPRSGIEVFGNFEFE